MNIIKTVGDLRKALSAYDESLPFAVDMVNPSAWAAPVQLNSTVRGTLNNDTAIYQESRIDKHGKESQPLVVITAIYRPAN